MSNAWGKNRLDSYQRLPIGITMINYIFDDHPTEITLPKKREGTIKNVVITAVPVLLTKEDSQAYIDKIIKGENDGLLVHYICSMLSCMHILDDSRCWTRKGKVHDDSIAICAVVGGIGAEGIGIPTMFNMTAFQHTAKVAAYVMYKNKLTANCLKRTTDCPEFMTSRWKEFKWIVNDQLKKLTGKK